MSGDYSRKTFDPLRDFSGVLMQQGRVQVDADWNELVGIISRRLRAETTDIIGRGTVPKETPDGFKIEISGGVLTIGRGRIYVDGLLAENHGKPPLELDAVLGEQRGTVAVPYNEQPYFPNAASVAPAPTGGGPHLVYLDVWQREVTYLEVPDLIEKAVGVDTTTRSQTVYQVRVLANVGRNVSCDTPDDQVGGWPDIIRPSDGRLSTDAVGVVSPEDPCVIPPSGGYRGLENRLYRVEIHDGGAAGTATFKWSRDNASNATSVTAITALDKLTVARVGRDNTLRFSVGDWIEITDDWLEFAQQPGLMRQIKDVDDATQIITLTTALPAGTFPTINAQGNTDPQLHTRIECWDHNGKVTDTNNNLLVDLDAPGSKGLIPVPPHGTSVVLEDGVQITFDTPASGIYRVGDFWCFAARTADASVEKLVEAPPRGIHHHYCRLALVTFPDVAVDCRTFWPPEFGGAECCDCSVCVTAESHNSGVLTIQHAIDQVKGVGGTVCLGPGFFELREQALQIDGAQSVKLRGHGWQTVLVRLRGGAAIEIQNCLGLTVEELSVVTAAADGQARPSIALRSSAGVTVQSCFVFQTAREDAHSAAIGLSGLLYGTIIERNVFVSAAGLAQIIDPDAPDKTAPLFTAGIVVRDNAFLCDRSGINFGRTALHAFETRLLENFLLGCEEGGISTLGAVAAGDGIDISENQLRVRGTGILIGTDGAMVSANRITALERGTVADGIVLTQGADKAGLDRCQILTNQITGVPGAGISIQTQVRSAMIKQNVIAGAGSGGIVMDGDSRAGVLTIENNQLIDIAAQKNEASDMIAGIRVLNAFQTDVAGNSINGFAASADQSAVRVGIQILASGAVRVAGNQLTDIGPEKALGETVGIELIGTFERADISGNFFRRGKPPDESAAESQVFALRIRTRAEKPINAGAGTAVSGATKSFFLLGSRLLVLSRGREMLGVRGNSFEAFGAAAAMLVADVGSSVLSENRCVFSFSRVSPVAVVTAKAVVASNNYLEGPQEFFTLLISVPRGAFTVLGNITTSKIQVNGAPLAAPWDALNAEI